MGLMRLAWSVFIAVLLFPIALFSYFGGLSGYLFGVGISLHVLLVVVIVEELAIWLIRGEKPFQSFNKTQVD